LSCRAHMKYSDVYLTIFLFIVHGHIIYCDGYKQDILVLYCNSDL